MTELNYAMPDPAWDYATIYHNCQQAKHQLEQLIQYMASIEDATIETDAEIQSQINAIGLLLNTTQGHLNQD